MTYFEETPEDMISVIEILSYPTNPSKILYNKNRFVNKTAKRYFIKIVWYCKE